MTDQVTILRCALCKRPFSYVPKATDLCAPGTRNQICDACAEACMAEEQWCEAERADD